MNSVPYDIIREICKYLNANNIISLHTGLDLLIDPLLFINSPMYNTNCPICNTIKGDEGFNMRIRLPLCTVYCPKCKTFSNENVLDECGICHKVINRLCDNCTDLKKYICKICHNEASRYVNMKDRCVCSNCVRMCYKCKSSYCWRCVIKLPDDHWICTTCLFLG